MFAHEILVGKDTPPAPLKRGGTLGDFGVDCKMFEGEILAGKDTPPAPLKRGGTLGDFQKIKHKKKPLIADRF